MKFISTLTVCCLTYLLSGCQSTPEPDMALPAEFTSNATLYPLKRPALTIRDDAYHQALGPYQITNMDLSGKSTEKVSTSTSWQTSTRGGLLFQLMCHDNINLAGDITRKYSTKAEQTFSFDVQSNGLPNVHSDCQILVFGHDEESLDNPVNSYNWQTSEHELSYLACRLTQQGLVSQLVVEHKAGEKPSYRLTHGTLPIEISPVNPIPALASYNAVFANATSGYLLQQNNQTTAALQLSTNQARLWLANTQPVEQQQWLVAALFSLQMYDWQDNQWPAITATH